MRKLMNLLHWLAAWISGFVRPSRVVTRDTYFPASGSHNSGNVKNVTLESIRETIGTASSEASSVHILHCAIFWSLRQFCKQELDDDLSKARRLVTLTGSPTTAQADSCQDFVLGTWGTDVLLTWIVKAVIEGSCEACTLYKETSVTVEQSESGQANEDMNPECLKVIIKGPLDEIASVVQQLAWFAASFTLPNSQVMTMSTATFYKAGQGLGFEIRPRIIALGDSDIALACWHRLFHGSVLAYGFPIAQRGEAKGVEIPFDLMTAFVQARTAMEHHLGGKFFSGLLMTIYPSEHLKNPLGVQWHVLLDGENSANPLVWDPRFESLRTFLE